MLLINKLPDFFSFILFPYLFSKAKSQVLNISSSSHLTFTHKSAEKNVVNIYFSQSTVFVNSLCSHNILFNNLRQMSEEVITGSDGMVLGHLPKIT